MAYRVIPVAHGVRIAVFRWWLGRHRLQTARDAAVEAAGGPDGGAAAEDAAALMPAQLFPADLRRRFEIRILPVTTMPVRSLRDIHAKDIGQLIRIRAMVIRAGEVRPLARVVTYTCDDCGCEVYQTVTSKQFIPVAKCPSKSCQDNKRDGRLHMQTRGSRFTRYQEVRVQELPEQVPVGHIPRTVTVVCRGPLARVVMPGDVITLAAIYTPTPYTGYRAIRAGLIADTYFEAMDVVKAKKSFAQEQVDDETMAAIDNAAEDDDIYSKLARSIAPEIYGHEVRVLVTEESHGDSC